METQALVQLLLPMLTVLGSGGAAWASVRASLNGQRQQIRDTRDHVIRIDERTIQISDRLARLEGNDTARAIREVNAQ